MHKDIHDICSKCDIYQCTKRSTKNYGHLPAKEVEADPWEVLCVDLIGLYTIKRQAKKDLKLQCVTILNPATGWFKMKEIPNKEAITIVNMVEQAWFTNIHGQIKLYSTEEMDSQENSLAWLNVIMA